jgi:hypothetical protein
MADEALRTTNDALRAVINQHTCVIAGVRYEFRLEWWAKEKDSDPTVARKLLNVACMAMTESGIECVQFHMLVSVTNLTDLPAMLEEALLLHLAQPGIERGSGSLETYRRVHRATESRPLIH